MTELRFETANYFVRPLTKGDISAAWGRWLLDPTTARLLNASCRKQSRGELEAYVDQFNNRDKILVGIFHRPTGEHVGIWTFVVSRGGSDVLANVVVGEDKFRSLSGLLEVKAIQTNIQNYLFVTRGFRSICASIVAHNTKMVAYLKQQAGWELIRRTMSPPSASGEMVELLLFRLTREAYLRRKGTSGVSRRSSKSGSDGYIDVGARL